MTTQDEIFQIYPVFEPDFNITGIILPREEGGGLYQKLYDYSRLDYERVGLLYAIPIDGSPPFQEWKNS